MRMRAKYVQLRHASATGVAQRWYSQYCRDGNWAKVSWKDPGPEEKYQALLALGEQPSLEAVNGIIGSRSWTHLTCDGCSDYVVLAVALGDLEPKTYCSTCLEEAHYILSSLVEKG